MSLAWVEPEAAFRSSDLWVFTLPSCCLHKFKDCGALMLDAAFLTVSSQAEPSDFEDWVPTNSAWESL